MCSLCIQYANLVTWFIQVPRQLHCHLHLHVVLEDAAAKRGLVVGLARRDLDGRLHQGLCHAGGHDADAAHGGVVVRPVHHRVRLFRVKPGAKQPVLEPDAEQICNLSSALWLKVSSLSILGTRRASARYMWYACRYELMPPMMGLRGP